MFYDGADQKKRSLVFVWPIFLTRLCAGTARPRLTIFQALIALQNGVSAYRNSQNAGRPVRNGGWTITAEAMDYFDSRNASSALAEGNLLLA